MSPFLGHCVLHFGFPFLSISNILRVILDFLCLDMICAQRRSRNVSYSCWLKKNIHHLVVFSATFLLVQSPFFLCPLFLNFSLAFVDIRACLQVNDASICAEDFYSSPPPATVLVCSVSTPWTSLRVSILSSIFP